jgi:hypothetical protein
MEKQNEVMCCIECFIFFQNGVINNFLGNNKMKPLLRLALQKLTENILSMKWKHLLVG